MSNGSELKSPGALALRKAGYVPLPRWWVLEAEMDHIQNIAKRHEAEINKIRKSAWKKQDD